MANVDNKAPILLHGKPSKNAEGYYYVTAKGEQKFRNRDESYHKKQSPKQKWQSSAFAYAQSQANAIWDDPEQRAQLEQEWRATFLEHPENKKYANAKGWKFALLKQQWQFEHPYEPWYADYLQHISETAARKTSSASVSNYMLKQQIKNLSDQLRELRAQLKAQQAAPEPPQS